jgi:hypothetical protein
VQHAALALARALLTRCALEQRAIGWNIGDCIIVDAMH